LIAETTLKVTNSRKMTTRFFD